MKQKIFNDPIHGHIELSELAVRVIDTPQFQRLRDISQLGGVYFVFPGAASNRFEHCLGVSHLARVFIERIKENQPELNITTQDSLCIEIAALCHDLGHGPFSHLFDGKFLPAVLKSHSFNHEHASIGILDILIEENNLYPHFQASGLNKDDIHFIKELILGDPHEAPIGFQWRGRGQKTFLYDILANKRNGIDVDKFDYFARDCHVLGVTKSFDALRLMKFARALPVEREDNYHLPSQISDGAAAKLEICFHVKEAWNIMELFHTRYNLHKRAYQHRVSSAIEMMIVEALILADPFLFIPGKDGLKRRMSDCVQDFHAYWRLGEYILRMIENSFEQDLEPARNMIYRIRKRDLFAFVGETLLPPDTLSKYKKEKGVSSENQIKLDILKRITAFNSKTDVESRITLDENDLFCQIVKIGYGKGKANPVSQLTVFYQPNRSSDESNYNVGLVPEDSISRMIPKEFEETYIRLYTRYKYQASTINPIFDQWCEDHKVLTQSVLPLKRKFSSTSSAQTSPMKNA